MEGDEKVREEEREEEERREEEEEEVTRSLPPTVMVSASMDVALERERER